MADQDPYAATAIQAPANDPYAATAVQTAVAAPTEAPTGPLGLNGQPLPFSHFNKAGIPVYRGTPASAGRYTSNNPTPPPIDWRTPITAMVPTGAASAATVADMGVNGMTPGKFLKATGQEFGTALGNVGASALTPILHPLYTAQQIVRQMADLPQAMSDLSYQALDQPLETIEGGIGQAATFDAAGEVVPKILGGARSIAEGGVRRLVGSGPGVASKLARAATEDNRVIDTHNANKQAEAQQKWQDAQAKADYDHKANLLKLRQQHEQTVRDLTEKARTGTVNDRASYWAKRQADKQAYDQALTEANKQHAENLASIQKTQEGNQAAENVLDLRRQHEQAYQQATAEHYVKESAADVQAKAEENTAWAGWRQKTAGKTLDGGQISSPLAKLRLTSPEVDRTLNQLEPRGDEVPQESPYAQLRERTAQAQFGKDYESLSPVKQDDVDDLLHNNGYSPEPIAFDPQAGQPISIDRVQRASSILQRYIRSGRFEGPLLGEMKQVAKVLRNAVTRASSDVGASAELEGARTATITYQDAFGRERRLPATARTVREQQINPTAFKERLDEERLAKARRYDPTLVDSYRKVKAAREALKKLPAEDQLRKSLQQIPPVKKANLPLPPPIQEFPTPRASNLPLPPVLPEPEQIPFRQPKLAPRKVISAADLQRANEASVRAWAAGLVGHLFWWTGVWPAFRMLSELTRGAEVSLKPLALMPAAGAAGMATEELMAQPAVMNFLIRATRQQVAQIPPDLRGAMPDIVMLARRRGLQVSPILTAYAATIQRNQDQQRQPAQQGAPQ